MAVNEETPAEQGEGFKNTPTTEKEQEMSDTTVREPIRPIYGATNDVRWDELAHYFEIHPEQIEHWSFGEAHGLEGLTPTERGEWHARGVLGIEGASAFTDDVAYPAFPTVQSPAWATKSEDRGVDSDSEHPVRVWFREVTNDSAMSSTVEQEAVFNPDTGEVIWRAPVLLVWADGNTQIRIDYSIKAWQLLSVLREGAYAFEQIENDR